MYISEVLLKLRHPYVDHTMFFNSLLQSARERGPILIRFNYMHMSFCVPTFTHKLYVFTLNYFTEKDH